jgi:integrase
LAEILDSEHAEPDTNKIKERQIIKEWLKKIFEEHHFIKIDDFIDYLLTEPELYIVQETNRDRYIKLDDILEENATDLAIDNNDIIEVRKLGFKLPPSSGMTKETRNVEIRPMILKNAKNVNKDGKCKIYIEIVAFYLDSHKKTKRIPTSIYVAPKNWIKQRVSKNDPEYIQKNILIDKELVKYQSNLLNREIKSWHSRDLPVQIKDLFPQEKKSLLNYIEDYIIRRKKLQTPMGTLKEFTTMKNMLMSFEKAKNIKLHFKDMNFIFSDDFYSHMLEKGYKSGTINKTFAILRTVLMHYYKRREEYQITELTDKFKDREWMKGEKSKNEPHPLTENEFNILRGYDFENENLNKTKDRFLLQCTTGMRYGDMFLITPKNIKDEAIQYYPNKTSSSKEDNLVIVPVNDISREILEKYGYDTNCLKISNQKYNVSLKLMFEKLNKEYNGIFSIYTSHDARDTFITFSINSGVKIPYLLSMVGQNKFEIMRRYFRENAVVRKDDMLKVTIFSNAKGSP